MIVTHLGRSPLLLCLPHTGERVHKAVGDRFSATGRLQTDLSWRLDHVLDLGEALDATILVQPHSRLVIDVDVDPERAEARQAIRVGEALCPTMTLDQRRIYREGDVLGPVEMEERRLLYHAPFHQALADQLARLRKLHGNLVLLDCQSARSRIRGIRDEPLTTLSIGTRQDTTCDISLRRRFERSVKEKSDLSLDANRYARGGYITARYGQPDLGVHAMTLLISQAAYLRHESPPFEPDRGLVVRLRQVLKSAVTACVEWARTRDMMQSAVQSDGVIGSNFGKALDELADLSGMHGLIDLNPPPCTALRGTTAGERELEEPAPSSGVLAD